MIPIFIIFCAYIPTLIISNIKKKAILFFMIGYKFICSALSVSKYNEDFSFLRNMLAGHFDLVFHSPTIYAGDVVIMKDGLVVAS